MIKGITVKKNENFQEWYQQTVYKGEFAKKVGISGCYVILSRANHMWESIRTHMDFHLKRKGVKNMYFPLFIRSSDLEKEKDHLEGFNPEVAWVMRTGNKNLSEKDKLAIRPTSECIIYPIISDMIENYKDLPFKINQWCNVVRWEFKDATPFIRSREFLWQEGHTCHESYDSAEAENLDILHLYKNTYAELLCVPTIAGCKTGSEKFSGADTTYTLEAFIPEAGKAIQAATSHNLGQKFSKIFDIKYQNAKMKNEYVYQNSWGFTTRSIGVALMVHGDDRGAVIPPHVAEIQIVVVPIFRKKHELDRLTEFYNQKLKPSLVNYRVYYDDTKKRPGEKFNKYERHGVPLRIELGLREIDNDKLTLCRRDTMKKTTIQYKAIEHVDAIVFDILKEMNKDMYKKAEYKLLNSLTTPKNKGEFFANIESGKMSLIEWCDEKECEEALEGCKSLCIPFEVELDCNPVKLEKCMLCGRNTKIPCLFGKSY
jgi:prolyl-tRNA synthetase